MVRKVINLAETELLAEKRSLELHRKKHQFSLVMNSQILRTERLMLKRERYEDERATRKFQQELHQKRESFLLRKQNAVKVSNMLFDEHSF